MTGGAAREGPGRLAAAEPDLAVGAELGGYRVEALIGRGGMGGRPPAARACSRAQGGPQAARAGARPGLPLSGALPARVEARGVARPPGDRPDLRGGRGRGPALHRDAARGGHRPEAAPGLRGTARAGARPDARRPAGGRARRCTRARPRASGRQALERPDRRPRPLLPRRLGAPPTPRKAGRPRGAACARWAQSTTSLPSRSAARSWTGVQTCTRSAACSTNASPADRPSAAAPTRRSCSRTWPPALPRRPGTRERGSLRPRDLPPPSGSTRPPGRPERVALGVLAARDPADGGVRI